MARPFVVQRDDHTHVPFLRGILTRSLQKAGLTFEESYRVASAVRDEISDMEEVESEALRSVVIRHLQPFGEEVLARYQGPPLSPETIVVESLEGGPSVYSRGRHSQDLLAAGLTAEDATVVSEAIYVELLGNRRTQISSDELRALTYDKIEAMLGTASAHRYDVWQEFMDGDRALIVLIGGAVGCGKSTIATELAHRLQIVRIQSSDMLREVMRTMIHPRLLPVLHESTYTAWTREPDDRDAAPDPPSLDGSDPPSRNDPDGRSPNDPHQMARLLRGYQEQSKLVAVASDAVLRRAIRERVSIIVEGVHVQPGFARRIPASSDAIVVHVTLAVLKKKRLKARIRGRSRQAPDRRAERYLKNFDAIWEIQSLLLDQADELGVPIIDNDDKDTTMQEVVRVILDTLASHFEGVASERGG